MSKPLRHPAPRLMDRDVLEMEARAVQAAEEIRIWYDMWNRAWDDAAEDGRISQSGSPLWRETTMIARQMIATASYAVMEAWINIYVGHTIDPGFRTPREAAEEEPY